MSPMELKGNYYIRARKTGWFVWYQSYKGGIRSQERVDDKAVRELGFKPNWSTDEARRHCKSMNAERSLQREKIRVSAKRVTEIVTLNETLFPQHQVSAFQQLLEEENFGTETNFKKLCVQFNFIQRMSNELRILPHDYKYATRRIYKYFIKRKTSVEYTTKLIAMLNRWGRFICKQRGSFYEAVPIPRGVERGAIADAQRTKTGTNTERGVRTASLPLKPEMLLAAKDKFSPEQYNWLLISVWFGLRPEEVDCLHKSAAFRIETVSGVSVLKIYQSKLRSVSEDRRWKSLPSIFAEQLNALDLIRSGNFKRPIHKTMRNYLGARITPYSGRKNFTDLMLDRGQSLEDISVWLGHKDISTTWRHYKNKDEVKFTKTKLVVV